MTTGRPQTARCPRGPAGAVQRWLTATAAPALLATALATTFPAWAQAEPFETRTYLDIGAGWSVAPEHAPQLRLGPFVREESRFREDGLVYVKAFAGVRASFLSWLRVAAYYAHKDLQGSGWRQAHMAALDLFVEPRIGPLVLSHKSGFEAHVTDEFFRYRNALELRWDSPLEWLTPFVLGELRVDSDAARINLLDAWAGLALRLSRDARSPLSLRLFCGYESNRRGRPEWSGIHLLGVALSAVIR